MDNTSVSFDLVTWMHDFIAGDLFSIDFGEPYGMLILTVASFFVMYALVMVMHVFVRTLLYLVNLGRGRRL